MLLYIAVLLHAETLGAQVTISPTRLFFNNVQGQTAGKIVTVSNGSKEPLIFNVSVKDWYRDSLGNKVYAEPGTLPVSNAGWMKVFPATVSLAPGESKELTVTMQVPQDKIPPVTNSMLFLTQVNEQKPQLTTTSIKDRKVGIIIKLQLGIHLYNELPGLSKKELAFTGFDDRGAVSDSVRLLAVRVRNSGEVATDGRLSFSLTHNVTGDEIKQTPVAIGMLPGAEQIVYIRVPARLLKGTYLAEAVLDSGTDTDLKVARKQISYE